MRQKDEVRVKKTREWAHRSGGWMKEKGRGKWRKIYNTKMSGKMIHDIITKIFKTTEMIYKITTIRLKASKLVRFGEVMVNKENLY